MRPYPTPTPTNPPETSRSRNVGRSVFAFTDWPLISKASYLKTGIFDICLKLWSTAYSDTHFNYILLLPKASRL